jgi:hypothetical protein
VDIAVRSTPRFVNTLEISVTITPHPSIIPFPLSKNGNAG